MKFAHIINPVKVGEQSDLYVAQPVTFASLKVAQEVISSDPTIDVELYTTQFPEDHEIIPEWFHKTPDLERSILDEIEPEVSRKLPFLDDLLKKLYEATAGADYLIYTNVDIAVMPNFYKALGLIAAEGHDAWVINRRTIPKKFTKPSELSMMYLEAGEKHAGFDCFVFKRELLPQINLGDAILGARWVGRIFILNLLAVSKSFECFRDYHLTFHIGNDRVWKNDKLVPYDTWNGKQLKQLIEQLETNENVRNHPLGRKLILKSVKLDNILNDRDLISRTKIYLNRIYYRSV